MIMQIDKIIKSIHDLLVSRDINCILQKAGPFVNVNINPHQKLFYYSVEILIKTHIIHIMYDIIRNDGSIHMSVPLTLSGHNKGNLFFKDYWILNLSHGDYIQYFNLKITDIRKLLTFIKLLIKLNS